MGDVVGPGTQRREATAVTSANAEMWRCCGCLPRALQELTALFTSTSRSSMVVGMLYLAATLLGSVRFLSTATSVLHNDFLWTQFNATSGITFVAAAFNSIVQDVNTTKTVKLTDAKFAYTPSASSIEFPVSYARSLQYGRLTRIEDGIQGLRSINAKDAAGVFTQYCWVDFDRRWSLAHTEERAERCRRSYTTNAAVYLESLLRNVRWWGVEAPLEQQLDRAVLAAISTLDGGVEFVTSVQKVTFESLESEAALWRRKGLTHYTLQFHNQRQIGVHEQIEVVNAFGVGYPLTIKRINYQSRSRLQTSQIMYWGFANDLAAVTSDSSRALGTSLVRNASTFYGHQNITMEQLVLGAQADAASWTSAPAQMFRAAVGPFGSVDMLWVPVPQSLFDLVSLVREVVLRAATTSDNARSAYLTVIDSSELTMSPSSWIGGGWSFSGGNPLCGGSLPTLPYVGQQVLFDDVCTLLMVDQWYVDRVYFVLSALAAEAVSGNVSAMADHCTIGTADGNTCSQGLVRALQFVEQFVSRDDRGRIAELVATAREAVLALNMSVIQFAQRTTAGNTTEDALLRLPIISTNASDPWNVFSWWYLLEWTLGQREVVSFEGDEGRLTLMSGAVLPNKMAPNPVEIRSSISICLRVLTMYVTVMLTVVACVVLLYGAMDHLRLAGLNLLEFNRVVGVVWIGRPLLVLRGVVAIAILSTSRPALVQSDALVWMEDTSQSWFNQIITAGEATWLLFVIVDLLQVLSRGRMKLLAPSTNLLTWVTVAGLQLVLPPEHVMVVRPECVYTALDTQIKCTSGAVHIGSITRLLTIGLITIVLVTVCYVLVVCLSVPDAMRSDAEALPGIAQEMYAQSEWIYGSDWCIDRASAAMAGLVSWRSPRHLYVLDIKLWSCMTIDRTERRIDEKPPHIQQAISLRELYAKNRLQESDVAKQSNQLQE